MAQGGPAAGGDPRRFCPPAPPSLGRARGASLAPLLNDFDFSPNEETDKGQAVIFVFDKFSKLFKNIQWFLEQRRGVFRCHVCNSEV